jgi:hypothetical protein
MQFVGGGREGLMPGSGFESTQRWKRRKFALHPCDSKSQADAEKIVLPRNGSALRSTA